MNHTENYHLPRWDMADRIQMADFNSMTGAIEDALTGHDGRMGRSIWWWHFGIWRSEKDPRADGLGVLSFAMENIRSLHHLPPR